MHGSCIVDVFTREGDFKRSRDYIVMGHRTRRRAAIAATPKTKTKPRDHQARVKVSDEVWREFRDVVGYESIAAYLGRLVERAVERDRARRMRAGTLDDAQLLDALERARELHGDLGTMVERLERRLDWLRD